MVGVAADHTDGRQWVVDGNNVMGSRPDGWWNDRPEAQRRLTQQVAEWCRTHVDRVLLVFDGGPDESVTGLAGGNLRVEFAPHRGRNAADDHIVEWIARAPAERAITVVTADRGLTARLPRAVDVMGPRTFLDLVAGHSST